jgi:uncharacterized radical SAM protein YgiQ
MATEYRLTDWLPTTKKELEIRGWEQVDVILFSGDAYVDHPSFGAAVVGRLLEAQGLKVALVPQPDWRGDFRDFTKLGRPRLFFAISAGCMDSMVNHYTANKRLRSDDAYTAGGKAGARPDYATVTYATILKRLYPDVPLVIGGIEASLRRLTHYDYWSDTVKPSILVESGADLLVYGMGEKPLLELCKRLELGERIEEMKDVPQTAYVRSKLKNQPTPGSDTMQPVEEKGVFRLYAHEECLSDKHKQASNFKHIEEASNTWQADTLIQAVGNEDVVVNPPFPTMTTEELDSVYALPFTRLPHPKYKEKAIPAYEMIKHSVNIHRGCFGGCAFCTISAHQGKFIVSRSLSSVLQEVRRMTEMDDFKGYISDLGGPSANMYRMGGVDTSICQRCKRPSCIHPGICTNLNTDHKPLIDLYKAVDALPGVKKSVIGSGIRYDLLIQPKSGTSGNKPATKNANNHATEYMRELITNHVSGRLKIAPEHVSDSVLSIMRKPTFSLFSQFRDAFEAIEDERMKYASTGRQQLIPYFISSHPGCTEFDMAELAAETKRLHFKLEQVQDFTPTPMTLATEMYYTGLNPYTLKPVFSAKTRDEKLAQREYFFWYKPESRDAIIRRLKRLNRPDLLKRLFG